MNASGRSFPSTASHSGALEQKTADHGIQRHPVFAGQKVMGRIHSITPNFHGARAVIWPGHSYCSHAVIMGMGGHASA
jgi:hypothetical protein